MPWDIKQKGKEYCVVDKDGKEVTCHDSEEKAKAHKEALYANAEEKYEDLQRLMLEDGSPVILGVAATNRPHLPLPPMDVVEKNGEEYIRVPFLRKGIFRHPSGNLVFNEEVMQKMLDNHNGRKSHYGVSLDLRHKPELGALAWFDKERGGFVELEKDSEYGDLLVGYGKPTSEEAKKMIKNKQYVFASVEFHPKWKGNLVQRLSMDEAEELMLEDLLSDEETTQLFNPYHSPSDGKFVSKSGASGVVAKTKAAAKNAVKWGTYGAASGAIIGGVTALVFDMSMGQSLSSSQRSQMYKDLVTFGTVAGGAYGATQGAVDSVIGKLEEAKSSVASQILKAYLDTDYKRFAFKSELDYSRAGFKKADGYWYMDREAVQSMYDKLSEKLEEIMEDVTISREEYDRLIALEAQFEAMKRESQEDELPENVRIRLEEQEKEIKRLKRSTLESQVESIITKAESYRDADGKGHSPVLLNLAKAAMLGLEVSDGDEVIKLESSEVGDVVAYNRKLWIKLLETNPGSVQLESRLESEEEINPYKLEGSYDKETFNDFWAATV